MKNKDIISKLSSMKNKDIISKLSSIISEGTKGVTRKTILEERVSPAMEKALLNMIPFATEYLKGRGIEEGEMYTLYGRISDALEQTIMDAEKDRKEKEREQSHMDNLRAQGVDYSLAREGVEGKRALLENEKKDLLNEIGAMGEDSFSTEDKMKKKCEREKVQSINLLSKILYDVKSFVDGWKISKLDNIDPQEHSIDNLKMFQGSAKHFGVADDIQPSYENALRLFRKNGTSGLDGMFRDPKSCAWEMEEHANSVLSEIGLTLREVLSLLGVEHGEEVAQISEEEVEEGFRDAFKSKATKEKEAQAVKNQQVRSDKVAQDKARADTEARNNSPEGKLDKGMRVVWDLMTNKQFAMKQMEWQLNTKKNKEAAKKWQDKSGEYNVQLEKTLNALSKELNIPAEKIKTQAHVKFS